MSRGLCRSARSDVHIEKADPEFRDFVAIGVSAGGFETHSGGDELGNVIGRVVFGLHPQPNGDAAVAGRLWLT